MIGSLIGAFDLLLYQPLFNFLVLLYNYLPGRDFGVAIIVLTVVIRLLLYPSSVKTIKTQKAISNLQPQIQEIQKKHKDDKEKQVKETLALYKNAKVSPFGSILPTLIQLPLLIALYRVFWRGFDPAELVNLYGFVANPGNINTVFLGLIDLSQPSYLIAILAGISQFIQTKTMMPIAPKVGGKQADFSRIMQKQMIYFFPFLTIIILLGLPSALGLYWMTGSAFLSLQQYLVSKKNETNRLN